MRNYGQRQRIWQPTGLTGYRRRFAAGRLLTRSWSGCATHANKKGRRYRYYVSQRIRRKASAECAVLPAGDLELVIGRVRDRAFGEAAIFHAIEPLVDVDERAVLEGGNERAGPSSLRRSKACPQLVQRIVSRDVESQ